jgi:hypothetical protein
VPPPLLLCLTCWTASVLLASGMDSNAWAAVSRAEEQLLSCWTTLLLRSWAALKLDRRSEQRAASSMFDLGQDGEAVACLCPTLVGDSMAVTAQLLMGLQVVACCCTGCRQQPNSRVV